jgi:hypothetical protein
MASSSTQTSSGCGPPVYRRLPRVCIRNLGWRGPCAKVSTGDIIKLERGRLWQARYVLATAAANETHDPSSQRESHNETQSLSCSRPLRCGTSHALPTCKGKDEWNLSLVTGHQAFWAWGLQKDRAWSTHWSLSPTVPDYPVGQIGSICLPLNTKARDHHIMVCASVPVPTWTRVVLVVQDVG